MGRRRKPEVTERTTTGCYTLWVLVENRASLSPAEHAALEGALGDQPTLQQVVRWGLEHHPPLMVRDVVVQDEFTHDVVLPYPNGRFLAYDTT